MTDITRRTLLGTATALGGAAALPARSLVTDGWHKGPFQPNWDSLTTHYRAPDWYRDAKLGFWAHWSAQCVPEAGDWYAREMYLQGSRLSDFHRKAYGHPADIGFMEIQNLWKAQNWDPERLIGLFKRAGGKYFVALANHHDNLDTYDSRHHAWNSVRVGPKRDIIGTWAKAARAAGLHFGVSNHSSHAWHWLQPAYGYDAEGPRRGERYDAYRLTAAQGRGKWWEGLDPQQLYAGRAMVIPDGIGSILEASGYHARVDRMWHETVPAANPGFARQWTLRCRDLIDRYAPDFIYFDDTDLPFGQNGLDIVAHHYNSSIARTGGLNAVVTAKTTPPERRMGIVDDVERGGKSYIELYPWQTDTCIGDWHYKREIYEKNGYKSAATVLHTLCDVITKNGNLLVSIPIRGDGTIDDKEEAILDEIAAWMARYGDAIHGTRPWRWRGEGPTRIASGMFAEGGPVSPFGADDIRYVRKGDVLHAIFLGWPADNIARAPMLGRANAVARGEIDRITLFGGPGPLPFRRKADVLEIDLPPRARTPIGFALAIHGRGLTEGSVAP